jgi:FkbM family methyltransferase
MGEAERFFIPMRRGLEILLTLLPQEFIQRLGTHLGVPSIRWSLMQLKRFGFLPFHIMDVGAFRGDWAKICAQIFPESQITCVEPQDHVQDILRGLAANHSNIRVIQTLLGKDIEDSVSFNELGPGSSVLLSKEKGEGKSMETIDHLVDSGICNPPEFLKLDVQGYEIEVLEGYKQHFSACQVIQCELSLIAIVQGTPLLHDVVTYFHERGFEMWDVDELIRAPSDGAVWQLDALFCKTYSPLRAQRIWRTEAIQHLT